MTHVIVTGGSSGIGLAVARAYARRGFRLSLIARGLAALEAARIDVEACGAGAVHLAAADVADEPSLHAAIRQCEAALGACDILIASAGIVEPAAFDTQSFDAFHRQVAVNLFGTVHAARAVYPGMIARGSGRIMLVSSGAGLIGIPGYSGYCASKYGLRGFAEALRFEARPYGVTISICFPPDTRTPQFNSERSVRPPEAEVIMGRVRPWSADAVAARIVRGVERGRFEVFCGITLLALGRFGSLASPLLRWWFDGALRRSARG